MDDDNACPSAKVFSIDSNLSQRVYINDNVKYFEEDFNYINWKNLLELKIRCVF